eukprot:scaffold95797_cov28-Tisochrysis_lutea.AAC.2
MAKSHMRVATARIGRWRRPARRLHREPRSIPAPGQSATQTRGRADRKVAQASVAVRRGELRPGSRRVFSPTGVVVSTIALCQLDLRVHSQLGLLTSKPHPSKAPATLMFVDVLFLTPSTSSRVSVLTPHRAHVFGQSWCTSKGPIPVCGGCSKTLSKLRWQLSRITRQPTSALGQPCSAHRKGSWSWHEATSDSIVTAQLSALEAPFATASTCALRVSVPLATCADAWVVLPPALTGGMLRASAEPNTSGGTCP